MRLDSFDFTRNGRDFVAEIHVDEGHGAPWEEEDGHGPVTDWERRDKRPGELVLADDGRAKLFYDFAEACRIARRDGWGTAPGRLEYAEIEGGWIAHFRNPSNGKLLPFEGRGETVNHAISAVYAQHRATMTPRQYAAAAAMADFERLRAYCRGDWHYVGVVVRPADACECCGLSESLWGIESDSTEYLREVAEELADQIEPETAAAA